MDYYAKIKLWLSYYILQVMPEQPRIYCINRRLGLFLEGNCIEQTYHRRTQISEALGKHLASDVFEYFSTGTDQQKSINQDAVRRMKMLYGIGMEAASR